MRLLVYGGTRYAERVRIGEWPPVPVAALQDFYGLNSDIPAFGVGLLGGSPFLIVREWHNRHDRGGYAFSVLFDPGADVWRKWQFNAAALVAALINGPSSRWETFRREPDKLTEVELARVMEAIPVTLPPAGNFANDIPSLWLDATLGNTTSTLAPMALGFSGRPTPTAVAALLQQLPPCFRVGQGWLVGGGDAHGSAYGARLVVDDERPPEISEAAGTAIGQALYRLVSALAHGEIVSDELQQLASQPITEWEGPLSESVNRLSLLAGMLTDEFPESAGAVFSETKTPARFNAALRDIAWSILNRGEEAMSAARTRFVISGCVRYGFRIGDVLGRRLNSTAAIEALLDLGIPPGVLPVSLDIPNEMALCLGVTFLERVSETADVAASQVLGALGRALREEDCVRLVEVALATTVSRLEPLAGWLPRFGDDPLLGQLVNEQLCLEARRRGHAPRPSSWASDYVAFGCDPGGAKLSETLDRADMPALLDALHRPGERLERVTSEWIEALAVSPLRSRLPVAAKANLAAHAFKLNPNISAWTALHVLHRLWEGEDVTDTPKVRGEERERLQREIIDLAAERSPRTAPPKLRKIELLLGKPPNEVLTHLTAQELPLEDTYAVQEYLQALHGIDTSTHAVESRRKHRQDAERLLRNLRSAITSHGAQAVARKLTQDHREVRAELWDLLIDPPGANAGEQYSTVFADLLRGAAQGVPSLDSEARSVLQVLPLERRTKAAVRYRDEPPVVEALLRGIGDSVAAEVVVALLRYDKQAFINLAARLLRPYQHMDVPDERYPRLVNAVTRYLLNTPGETTNAIATQAFGSGGVRNFPKIGLRLISATKQK